MRRTEYVELRKCADRFGPLSLVILYEKPRRVCSGMSIISKYGLFSMIQVGRVGIWNRSDDLMASHGDPTMLDNFKLMISFYRYLGYRE